MSTLTTAFAARYSAARVRNLCNPDNQAGTDATAKLAIAETDATQEFQTMCGVAIDTTDANHVRVAVLLMEYLLVRWGAGRTPEATALWEDAEKMAQRVSKVTGRDRILPDTNSGLTVTGDAAGERPAFDPLYLGPIILNPPNGGYGIRSADGT